VKVCVGITAGKEKWLKKLIVSKVTFVGVLLILHSGLVYADAHQDTIQACTQLVIDYAFYRDRPDAKGVAELFSEDATFTLLGTEYKGRQAIRARVAAGVGGPVYRHLISTINIRPAKGGREARGVTYVTVYQGQNETLPQTLTKPMVIGEYHDRFVLTDTGWKISERVFVPVFLPTTQDE